MDDTTLITESKEELKKLLMRVKEESEKASLKLSIKKWRYEINNQMELGGGKI